MRGTVRLALAATASAALIGCGAGAGATTTAFTTRVDNPWLPLRPGTTLVYEGVKDGKHNRDVFMITGRTKVVGGVRCVVVDDRGYENGRLAERTSDYYSEDSHGNVWYFGEDTAELDAHGHVTSTEGTWHTGVDGARAGLFMPAHPRLGEQHRQEYYRGHAEDQFRVVSLRAPVTVPYRSFAGALRTREWTRLEPGVLDGKWYVRGIGEVAERSLHGPQETAELVSLRMPR